MLPASRQVSRLGNLWSEISFGTVSYFKTPRLRALCALYLGVSAASAMIIVNTVIYVKENLGLMWRQPWPPPAPAQCSLP